MKVSRIKGLLLVSVAVFFLTFLFIKTQGVDLNKHNQIIDRLRQLKQLDATLNQDILKLRYGLLNHYDPVVTTLQRIQVSQEDLKSGPLAIYGKGYESTDQRIEALEKVLTEKAALLEEFPV